MVTFRNNNNARRNSFRRNDRNFKSSGDRPKFGSNYSNNDSFITIEDILIILNEILNE